MLDNSFLLFFRSCKRLFSCPSARENSYQPKLKCMTLDVANDISPAQWQGGSLTHPNSSSLLQMLQTNFLLLIGKGGELTTQTLVHDSRCCKRRFSCPLARVLPTQLPEHDSRCCKRLFYCPQARGSPIHPNSTA